MDQNRPMTKRERQEARRLEKIAQGAATAGSDTAKWLILGVGVAIFLIFFGFLIFSIKQSKNKPVKISSAGFVRGASSASATLVEYGDLQCPACKVYEPFVRQALKDFDGKLKLIYKNFPLTSVHPNAMLAAKAAVAAGNQGKFYLMHDWLYDNQDSWAPLSASDAKAKMVAAAKSMNLAMDQFNRDIDSSETEAKIAATQSEGISVGVASTPTFFLNNKKVENNPVTYGDFKKLIQANL